jgi:hypothetical protein
MKILYLILVLLGAILLGSILRQRYITSATPASSGTPVSDVRAYRNYWVHSTYDLNTSLEAIGIAAGDLKSKNSQAALQYLVAARNYANVAKWEIQDQVPDRFQKKVAYDLMMVANSAEDGATDVATGLETNNPSTVAKGQQSLSDVQDYIFIAKNDADQIYQELGGDAEDLSNISGT